MKVVRELIPSLGTVAQGLADGTAGKYLPVPQLLLYPFRHPVDHREGPVQPELFYVSRLQAVFLCFPLDVVQPLDKSQGRFRPFPVVVPGVKKPAPRMGPAGQVGYPFLSAQFCVCRVTVRLEVSPETLQQVFGAHGPACGLVVEQDGSPPFPTYPPRLQKFSVQPYWTAHP